MNLSRRDLLSSAIAGTLTTVGPGLKVAFADSPRDVLVVIFQRGACDWLQMLAPAGDPNYIAARPTIRVQSSGNNAGLGLGSMGSTDFYLHNAAPELKALYDAGSLAFVHATGLQTVDRSHFTVQDMMERGFADGETAIHSGWLARHMASLRTASLNANLPVLSTIAASSSTPTALLTDAATVAIANVSTFAVQGGTANANLLRAMNQSGSPTPSAYKDLANETLNAVASVQAGLAGLDNSGAATAGYTNGALSQPLRSVAQLIKMNVGLTVATIDYGGWDMHNALAGEFNTRTIEFSRALNAFWNDLTAYRSNVTVVTMTEFGRRLQENTSQGTDHGSASGMLILGGTVNGGRIFGTWPGLAANQLHSGDLAVTTDYRQVLAEILAKRHAETNMSAVFPTLTYAPLGIVNYNS